MCVVLKLAVKYFPCHFENVLTEHQMHRQTANYNCVLLARESRLQGKFTTVDYNCALLARESRLHGKFSTIEAVVPLLYQSWLNNLSTRQPEVLRGLKVYAF